MRLTYSGAESVPRIDWRRKVLCGSAGVMGQSMGKGRGRESGRGRGWGASVPAHCPTQLIGGPGCGVAGSEGGTDPWRCPARALGAAHTAGRLRKGKATLTRHSKRDACKQTLAIDSKQTPEWETGRKDGWRSEKRSTKAKGRNFPDTKAGKAKGSKTNALSRQSKRQRIRAKLNLLEKI